MKKTASIGLAILLLSTIVFSGCGKNEPQPVSSSNHEGNMEEMHHSGSGELPANLKEKSHPTFPIGSKATMNADHMPGMKGAKATIVGAYETTAYAVTYKPTTGGHPVENHKWVIHEEIKDSADQPYKPGDEVILQADHMPGMKGAAATVETAEPTTVYMVDYKSTTDGEMVRNHKWVTEQELAVD
ncbi:YdhK family protein [Paenibacillus hubeiensis]|uniref:YdhK family protein n=1 Tax=Paenibacillus hubeiensis TaxID=3077330 RepID=UPI0031BABD9A